MLHRDHFLSLILYSFRYVDILYIPAKCQKAFNLIYILLHRSMFFVLQIRRTLETKAQEDTTSDAGKFVVSKIWGLGTALGVLQIRHPEQGHPIVLGERIQDQETGTLPHTHTVKAS